MKGIPLYLKRCSSNSNLPRLNNNIQVSAFSLEFANFITKTDVLGDIGHYVKTRGDICRDRRDRRARKISAGSFFSEKKAKFLALSEYFPHIVRNFSTNVKIYNDM